MAGVEYIFIKTGEGDTLYFMVIFICEVTAVPFLIAISMIIQSSQEVPSSEDIF